MEASASFYTFPYWLQSVSKLSKIVIWSKEHSFGGLLLWRSLYLSPQGSDCYFEKEISRLAPFSLPFGKTQVIFDVIYYSVGGRSK
jgi:hypothetical protein